MEEAGFKKPLQKRGGSRRDGNLYKPQTNEVPLYNTSWGGSSINAFSGVIEFDSFPLRQLFLDRHEAFPCEWDAGYLSHKFIDEYIEQHKDHVMTTHYKLNGQDVSKCLLSIGGEEHIYIYLYGRQLSYIKEVRDKYGVCLLFSKKTDRVQSVMDSFIDNFLDEEPPVTGNLHILVRDSNGFSLQAHKVNCPEIDFSINYNKDFSDINTLIIDRLSTEDSKGLVLLHGVPGGGKTTYIRYLIHTIEKKKVIYVPPNMTNSLSDPALIKFFLRHPNSILVIEDAENVLIERSEGGTQAIANILNLTDGLLSDCANIQIVATFNTDMSKIDKALLRKGRLIAKYEFKTLEKKRAKKLAKKLGVQISEENTLADIYNASEKGFNEKESSIGFKSNQPT